MTNFNSATIEGYLAQDPRVRETKTGKQVCTFAVAMNHFSDPDSSPRVSFIDIETWDKLATNCSKNLAKGRRVIVHGKLRQDRWEGKEGRSQSKILVVGREVQFLDPVHREGAAAPAEVKVS